MLAAERVGGHPFRTKTLILIAYRHALRVSELAALRWDQVDLKQGHLHVRKAKNGVDSTHPLHGTELRALKRLEREHERSPYVFVTERGGPLTTSAVRKLVTRAGEIAGLGFPVHPHILRSALWARLRRFKIAPCDFVQWLEHDMRGAVPIRRFQSVVDEPLGGKRETFGAEGGPRNIPAQPFEFGALIGGGDHAGMQSLTPFSERSTLRHPTLLVYDRRDYSGCGCARCQIHACRHRRPCRAP